MMVGLSTVLNVVVCRPVVSGQLILLGGAKTTSLEAAGGVGNASGLYCTLTLLHQNGQMAGQQAYALPSDVSEMAKLIPPCFLSSNPKSISKKMSLTQAVELCAEEWEPVLGALA